MPVIVPTTSLAARDLKNEPWPQSWKMMKTRTMNPADRTMTGSASQKETASRRYATYHSAR